MPASTQRGRAAYTILVLFLAAAVCSPPATGRSREQVRIVYDSEFKGYIPVVRGVERPDLVTRPGDGRAPDEIRTALRVSRRAMRRDSAWQVPGTGSESRERASRRWKRRRAIVTELQVYGAHEIQVAGARVYRYIDPAFYPVNEEADGARLFGTYRYLPYPFPAVSALSVVRAHDETWRDEGMAPVAAAGPDIDHERNAWLDERRPMPRVPIEFVGTTDESGRVTAISGVFNLRDEDRFPRAVVPSSIRVGYVVIADGYRPAFSEKSFTEGGLSEARTVKLLEGPGAPLLHSLAFRAAEQLVDAIDVTGARTLAEIEAELARALESLTPAAARLEDRWQLEMRREAEASLIARLYRRAPHRMRLALARRAAELTPDSPARLYRLAREVLGSAGLYPGLKRGVRGRVAGRPLGEDLDAERGAGLEEAELLLRRALQIDSGFVPAYGLLDAVLAERGVGIDERGRSAEQLLRLHPFERWGRARVAVSLLSAGRTVEGFDHLRYTWAMSPGLGGDVELGRALADHYWRLGLTEKAGIFTRLLSGTDPEDPRVRVRRGSQ